MSSLKFKKKTFWVFFVVQTSNEPYGGSSVSGGYRTFNGALRKLKKRNTDRDTMYRLDSVKVRAP